MQAYAQRQRCPGCCPKVLLVHRQTAVEFERDAHRTPGIVFLRHRHPEHGHKALAHYGMESSTILEDDVLGQSMKFQ
jgi:hypothetical protein